MSGQEIRNEIAQGLADAGAETGSGSALIGTLTRGPSEDEDATPWDESDPDEPDPVSLTVVITEFTRREIDGEMVKASDKKILIEAGKITPRQDDRLKIGGVTYIVMSVSPLNLGGVDLMYEVQGRA